ncbi:MAG: carboxypeptidase regulatory-like domain-containing protein [Saprospiraceae bacterium]|nr:carboxypeptidase regulatory-like domain-containing protein [Pyrinomonadaceae bacterium]
MNKNNRIVKILVVFVTALPVSDSRAQTGGGFDLSHSVIASGGGSGSTGGSGGQTFSIDGTIGQAIAGTQSSGTSGSGTQFSLRGGFWAFQAAVPTASEVSVGGRVLSANGMPISKARVSLLDASGGIRMILTNGFGHYRFDAIEAGRVYVVEVRNKRFQFVPQVVTVSDELTNLDFVALP